MRSLGKRLYASMAAHSKRSHAKWGQEQKTVALGTEGAEASLVDLEKACEPIIHALESLSFDSKERGKEASDAVVQMRAMFRRVQRAQEYQQRAARADEVLEQVRVGLQSIAAELAGCGARESEEVHVCQELEKIQALVVDPLADLGLLLGRAQALVNPLLTADRTSVALRLERVMERLLRAKNELEWSQRIASDLQAGLLT